MSALIPYQYVVLRCVPRVEREEFVNVGVVVYAQASDALRLVHAVDRERLAAFAPTVDLDAVCAALDTIDKVCRGEASPGLPDLPKLGQRFGWIAAPRSTVVQPSPVHGGRTDDIDRELDRLCRRLVCQLDGL